MAVEWVLAISTVVLAIATILVFITAVFQDLIRSWITRPKLKVSLIRVPPDCHKVPMYRTHPEGALESGERSAREFITDSYYFRVRVENNGNQKAESVEIFLDTLLRKQADGTFASVEAFLPLNLQWSHYHKMMYMPAISPGTYKRCDIGHIVDPQRRELLTDLENMTWAGVSPEKTIFSLDTIVKSYTRSHLIPPGEYQLGIIVAATNTKPVRKTLNITLTGEWYADEREMLEQGIGITLSN